MGQFFDKTRFTEADYRAFHDALHKQLHEFQVLLHNGLDGDDTAISIGAELEMYLVDTNFSPLSINQQLIKELHNPLLQEELNRYNLEFNLSPVFIDGQPFSAMNKQLVHTLDQLQSIIKNYDGQILPIGILPTLKENHLDIEYMTDLPRYKTLTQQLSKLKDGPFNININGDDSVSTQCDEVTLEGANTSFQLHLKVPSYSFKNYFNAAQLVTPIVTAIAANSPIFLGKKLWHETRIALFKQSIDSRNDHDKNWRSPARVTYGSGWVRNGIWELFAENISIHPPIIPLKVNKPFGELCLHHGTVWNWNRAVFDPGDNAHTRIEYRSLPAGPTVNDMLANSALMIGLTQYFSHNIEQYISRLPFKYAEYNFYRAAQHGINAKLIWPSLHQEQLAEKPLTQILASLLEPALQGLIELGVNRHEANFYLQLIQQRLDNNQTGASWQLAKYNHYAKTMPLADALKRMLNDYKSNMLNSEPVATWL